MRAGVGKALIQLPEDFYPYEGFKIVLDALKCRVFIIEAPNDTVALVSIELTSLLQDEVLKLKSLIRLLTGFKRQPCWISVSLTFSAPHFFPEFMLYSVEE